MYRDLRENYEYNMRYDMAGKFFIREMELKRNYKIEGKKTKKKDNCFQWATISWWICIKFSYARNENHSCFEKSIKKSIDIISNLENKNISLIFYASGDYVKYYTVTLCFKLLVSITIMR